MVECDEHDDKNHEPLTLIADVDEDEDDPETQPPQHDELVKLDNDNDDICVSVPLPEELKTAIISKTDDKQSHSLRRTRIWYWCGVLAFVVALIVLTLSVVSARSNKKQTNDASSPVAAGSTTTRQATRSEIEAFLKAQGITNNYLQVAGSPHYQALKWLAEEDEANLSVPTTTDDSYNYLTRYIMALHYFALGKHRKRWETDLHWFSAAPVCSWNDQKVRNGALQTVGVECDNNDNYIVRLHLDGNDMRGPLPTELGLLTTLEMLDLRSNIVTGSLPTELCHLTDLQTLAVSENALTGPLPACLSQLTQLQWLYLHSNLLTGSLPTELAQTTTLQRLVVESNLLSGNPLPLLQSLTNLEYIFADNNVFSGALPADFLLGHSHLQHLDLSLNNLTLSDSNFPSHLLQMQSLESLDLSRNHLSGHLVNDETTVLQHENRKLQYLSLHDNKLNGGLSSQLQQLVALKHLDVSNNELHGPIRKELGQQLTHLEYLFLSNNNFQPGSIPTEFQQLTNLVDFSMRGTHRDGPLPAWIGTQLTNLVLLDLGQNDFNRTVPVEFSQLRQLQYLLLNGNPQLRGSVPSELGSVASLSALFLDGTALHGDLEFLCPATANTELIYADCLSSTKAVNCTCCECCRDDPDGCSEPYLADLDSSLEHFFERTEYNLYDKKIGDGGRRRL